MPFYLGLKESEVLKVGNVVEEIGFGSMNSLLISWAGNGHWIEAEASASCWLSGF